MPETTRQRRSWTFTLKLLACSVALCTIKIVSGGKVKLDAYLNLLACL